MNTLNLKIDKDKCIKCAKCTNDCITSAIKQGDDGYPVEINPAYCISCQHCLMVCPVGALSMFDKDPSNSSKIENKVKEEDLFNLIQSRRSIRKFKGDQIPMETLEEILKCGTYAPNCKSKQSARIVVVRNRDTIEAIAKINGSFVNKPGLNPFYEAPTLLIVFADKTVATYVQDGSAVIMNMLP